jgi:hypothetical protein
LLKKKQVEAGRSNLKSRFKAAPLLNEAGEAGKSTNI